MNITLHRGQGEIGGTCLQVTDGDSSVLLDFGKPLESVGFSDYGEEADSKLLPPIPGIYRNDREKPSVHGVIISHYHEDHWGLTGSLKDSIPLYLPGKARDLILGRFICWYPKEPHCPGKDRKRQQP
jgi:ribonuclease J